MAWPLVEFVGTRIKLYFVRNFSRIVEINQKYRHPSIKMTPLVSWSLILLRIYLLVLISLIFYKFWTLVR